MHDDALFVGLDVGTSGARAIATDASGRVRGEGSAQMGEFGTNHRAPSTWLDTAEAALTRLFLAVDGQSVAAIAVDGTSGTMVATDEIGRPLGDGLMYNDRCDDPGILSMIDDHASEDSAARGATSALARAVLLDRQFQPARLLHQADWIAGMLSGAWVTDANNALKTGFDPVAMRWPAWLDHFGGTADKLPKVLAPGRPVAEILAQAADRFGISRDAVIVSGTTDGCASFLATGASTPGDGVTALGTTITIKMLSDTPIFAPEFGIYSHLVLGNWLAGGASNSGGNVLLAHFDPADLTRLSATLDPETDSTLDYYPLTRPGERFPISDPDLPPSLSPRPDDDALFLKGMLEGMAGIEALAYRRLHELGAPLLSSVRTVGGGADNAAWTRIRERRLSVPSLKPFHGQAAYGTALVARAGVST